MLARWSWFLDVVFKHAPAMLTSPPRASVVHHMHTHTHRRVRQWRTATLLSACSKQCSSLSAALQGSFALRDVSFGMQLRG